MGPVSATRPSATSTDTGPKICEIDEDFGLGGGWAEFEVHTAEDGLQSEFDLANLTPSKTSYLDPTSLRADDVNCGLITSVAPNEPWARDYRLVWSTGSPQ